MKTLVLALVCAAPAMAHDAPTGWSYAAICCSGRDCAQASVRDVTASPEGWRVHLEPGEHPMAPDGFTALVPFDDRAVRRSGDQFFHVCISVTTRLLCLYVPDMAS